MTRAAAAPVLAAILLALTACTSSSTSVTTSIREGDCRAAPAELKARFDDKDLGVQQCAGAQGWDVLVVSSDANSWIELRSSTTSWSSEVPIVYEMPIGLFPGVQSDAPLEWRSDGDGLRALLFTVSAQDPADAATRVRRIYVARFTENGQVCIIGRERTMDEARILADSDTLCAHGDPGAASRRLRRGRPNSSPLSGQRAAHLGDPRPADCTGIEARIPVGL